MCTTCDKGAKVSVGLIDPSDNGQLSSHRVYFFIYFRPYEVSSTIIIKNTCRILSLIDDNDKIVEPGKATKRYRNTFDERGKLIKQQIFFTAKK